MLCFLVALQLYPRDLYWTLEYVNGGGSLIQNTLHGCLLRLHLDVSQMVPPSPNFVKDITFFSLCCMWHHHCVNRP